MILVLFARSGPAGTSPALLHEAEAGVVTDGGQWGGCARSAAVQLQKQQAAMHVCSDQCRLKSGLLMYLETVL